MRVLGIDPGIATTGCGIVETISNSYKLINFEAIITPANTPAGERLKTIYKTICKLIITYKPDEIAVEKLFFAKNIKTAMAVSEARGVILLATEGHRLTEYTPLQVKMALVGYGRADKTQIQQMVKLLLGLKVIPKPDDAADALAIAICHINSCGRKT